jgi:hypothetical protein
MIKCGVRLLVSARKQLSAEDTTQDALNTRLTNGAIETANRLRNSLRVWSGVLRPGLQLNLLSLNLSPAIHSK